MDIDRFITRNEPTWARLEQLTAQARRGVRPVGPGGVEELVTLYQRVSSHLSHARTTYADRALVARLTSLVAGASGVIYGKRARSVAVFMRFWALTFPGAVYHCRRAIAASACAFIIPFTAMAIWVGTSDTAFEASAPEAAREAYVNEQFEAYYSSEPAASFASRITVNNIMVSLVAFATGIFLGVGPLVSMGYQGAYFGQVAGWFIAYGVQERFWGLVTPHGLLELTAIMIAGGAGLRLGWAVVSPGERTRADAVTEEGRRSVVIVMGLAAAFTTAALIEAYITPSGLPTGARIAVGASVWLAFLTYLAAQGRRAAAAGITGLIGEQVRRWDDEAIVAPVASRSDDAALSGALTGVRSP